MRLRTHIPMLFILIVVTYGVPTATAGPTCVGPLTEACREADAAAGCTTTMVSNEGAAAAVEGYAVVTADTPQDAIATVPVYGVIAAGHLWAWVYCVR